MQRNGPKVNQVWVLSKLSSWSWTVSGLRQKPDKSMEKCKSGQDRM